MISERGQSQMCRENLVFSIFGQQLEISNQAFYLCKRRLRQEDFNTMQLVFKEIIWWNLIIAIVYMSVFFSYRSIPWTSSKTALREYSAV